jgi:flagellar motor protein MotB
VKFYITALLLFWIAMFAVERADNHNLKQELSALREAHFNDQQRAQYCAEFGRVE